MISVGKNRFFISNKNKDFLHSNNPIHVNCLVLVPIIRIWLRRVCFLWQSSNGIL